MKVLSFAYLAPFLVFELVRACCEPSASALGKKLDLWQQPFFRKRAVEITEKRFLSILGLDHFPNPGRHVIPHSFMLELYKKLSGGEYGGEEHLEDVDTVVGVVDQDRSDSSVTPTSQQMLYFNISTVPSSHQIIAADLRVLRRPTVAEQSLVRLHGTTYRAKLYGSKASVQWPALSPFESSNFELIDSLTFDITDSAEQWNVFSVKKSVEKWQKANRMLHLLELRVESATSGQLIRPEDVGFSKAGRLQNKHALLVVYSSDRTAFGRSNRKRVWQNKTHTSNAISEDNDSSLKMDENGPGGESSRVRRDLASSAGISNAKKGRRGAKSKRRRKKDSCRRKPLYVDFKQLGWSNWVIAPRGYSAFFCQGLCEFPIDNHLKPSNHATVQTILNSVEPSLAPQACCTPNKLSAISILFIDTSDNIVYKKYEDMVVERCGCS